MLKKIRKRAGARGLDYGLRGLSAIGRLHPKAKLHRHGVTCTPDIPYGADDGSMTLDIYTPPGDGPFPVVFYVHGGGFRILSKDTHWMMGLMFARHGWMVVNIDYTLGPFSQGVQDTFRAWAWTQEHIASYGGDPDRIVVAGESAGANLVSALTVAACFEDTREPWAAPLRDLPVPAATMPYCGILEVTNHHRYEEHDFSAFIRDRLLEVCQNYTRGMQDWHPLCDPLVVFESDAEPFRPLPPFFTTVGTADPIYEDTVRLWRALERREVPVTHHEYADQMHAFHAMLFLKQAHVCWADTYAFLDRLLETS